MKFLLLLAGIALLPNIHAIPALDAANNGLPKGYKLAEPIFQGEIDGKKYEIKGHVQSVLAELEQKFPTVDFDARGANMTAAGNGTSPLTKRGGKRYPPLCVPIRSQMWNRADDDDIGWCAFQHYRVGGVIQIGPRSCILTCCNDSTRVFLCNDRWDTIWPNSGYIGSYATDIRNMCWWFDGNSRGPKSGGQLFDWDNYNVIVRRSDGALGDRRC